MPPVIPRIDLLEFDGLGLIIQWPSGVRYTNQVAGYGCEHPEIEGIFVPLFDGVGRPALHAFQQHFRGDWHPLVDHDADIVDGILRRASLSIITCDRTMLSFSRKAWVWMSVKNDDSEKLFPRIEGFNSCTGVLTWQNSD